MKVIRLDKIRPAKIRSSIVYCTGKMNGTLVFLELTSADAFALPSKMIPVFEERGGELVMHEIDLSELTDVKVE